MAEGPSALPHLHDELAPTTDGAGTSPDDTVLTMSRALRRLARRPVAQAVTPRVRLGLLDELTAPDRVQPFIKDELLPRVLAPEPAAFEPSATTATTTITPRQRRCAEDPAPRRW
jgi:hypothetical protein